MKLFTHNGSMGDIIYSLPTIIKMGGGAVQLTKDNQYRCMYELMNLQECVCQVLSKKETIAHDEFVDLNKYRKIERENFKNKTFEHLAICHSKAMGVEIDLEKSWLRRGKDLGRMHPSIIVNRTKRYHGDNIDWKVLKRYRNNVGFIGFHNELKNLESILDCTVMHYVTFGAHDMVDAITNCKLFIGNQSLPYAIAEALKVPRVLEIFKDNPNCMPVGKDSYLTLTEEIIERYIKK